MKPVGKFNVIPVKLKEKLRKLEPGQSVIFELTKFEIDHKTGEKLFGSAVELPGRDTINYGGDIYDIGVVKTTDGDKVTNCEGFILGGSGSKVSARFELNGDNPMHVQWFWFFQLCSFNASNPLAPVGVTKLIREIDVSKEATRNINIRSTLAKALLLTETMDAEECRMFAAAKGWDATADLTVIRDLMGAYAQNDPANFILRAEDETTKLKAELGMALNFGEIHYDQANHSVKNKDGVLLAKLERVEGKEWLDLFWETLNVMKDGAKIKADLRRQVKAKVKQNLSLRNLQEEGAE